MVPEVPEKVGTWILWRLQKRRFACDILASRGDNSHGTKEGQRFSAGIIEPVRQIHSRRHGPPRFPGWRAEIRRRRTTAMGLLEALRPNYAWAQQVPKDDKRIKIEMVTIPSPQGNGEIKGPLVRPVERHRQTAGRAGGARKPRAHPVHRGCGAAAGRRGLHGAGSRRAHQRGRLSGHGRSRRGGVRQSGPQQDDGGFRGGGAVAQGACRLHRQDRRGGLLLRRRDREHAGGAVGRGSQRRRWPSMASSRERKTSPKIKAPMLLHYASLDTRITGGWPAYEEALKANHVTYTGYVYEGANHGFHNDTTPRYDEAAAKLAWQRTLDFFNKYLKS